MAVSPNIDPTPCVACAGNTRGIGSITAPFSQVTEEHGVRRARTGVVCLDGGISPLSPEDQDSLDSSMNASTPLAMGYPGCCRPTTIARERRLARRIAWFLMSSRPGLDPFIPASTSGATPLYPSPSSAARLPLRRTSRIFQKQTRIPVLGGKSSHQWLALLLIGPRGTACRRAQACRTAPRAPGEVWLRTSRQLPPVIIRRLLPACHARLSVGWTGRYTMNFVPCPHSGTHHLAAMLLQMIGG